MTTYVPSFPSFDESGLCALDELAILRLAARVREYREGVPVELRSDAMRRPGERAALSRANDVAVIPIHDVITKRASFWTDVMGGTALDALSQQLAQARADDSVRAVLLDVDSPGGGVYGTDEVAEQIAELNAQKPVVAFVSGLAASAAYWLASGSSRIVASPSSDLGSIGVYALHFDTSGALREAGIVPTLIKAGEFKAEGNPYFPLSDDDRDAMQERIATHYARFVSRVAKGRGVGVDVVRKDFGRGRVLDAASAARVGMATDIGGFNDAIRIATKEARERSHATAQSAGMRPRSDSFLSLQLQLEEVAR
jgi:signal peptide peptidase SppA